MVKQSDKLCLFDVDGTLIRSGHPLMSSRFAVALEKVYGIRTLVDWGEHIGVGSTDRKVVTDVLRAHGLTDKEVESHLQDAYDTMYEYVACNIEEGFTKWLFPGVKSTLKNLKDKGVFLGVLSGNYEPLAWFKLEQVGIREFFDLGIFGNHAQDRFGQARLVSVKTKEKLGRAVRRDMTYFIGDTPIDIKSGKLVGAKTIGVTTGKFDKRELLSAGADLVVYSLKEPKLLKFIES